MAKALSEKSRVIREAIKANPGKGNTELVDLINKSEDRQKDKIKVTAQDVGNQRSALKALAMPAASGSHEPVAVPDPAAAPPTTTSGTTRNGRPRKKKPGRKPGRKPKAQHAAASVTPVTAAPKK